MRREVIQCNVKYQERPLLCIDFFLFLLASFGVSFMLSAIGWVELWLVYLHWFLLDFLLVWFFCLLLAQVFISWEKKNTSILEAMIQNKRYREKYVLIHLDTNDTLFDHFRLMSYSQPKRIMMTMKQLTHLYPVMHRPIHRHANENISIPMQWLRPH